MEKNDFASVKLPRPFLVWLKLEAARQSIPIYQLLENLVAKGRAKPWLKRTDDAT